MKKILNSLMILATFAASFASCTKEINNQEEELVVGKMKTVTVKTDIATRTTLDANHENIIWSEGDKISIFNDQNNDNLEKEYTSGGDLIISVPEETEEIFAHYPYYSGNTNGPESVSIYISNKQTQEKPGQLEGKYYPMVAKGTVSTDNKALISLYPVASALALNIYHTGLNGEESVKSVKVTPAAANTKFTGSQVTSLTGDNITYTEAASSDPITVTLTNPLALGNSKPTDKQKFAGQIYVCLAKQSYAKVTFEIVTDKGTYTITSSETTPFDCVNNDFVPVNINLAKAKIGPTVFNVGTEIASVFPSVKNGIKFSYEQGTSTNAPVYYSPFRWYVNSTVTISAGNTALKGIEFSFASGYARELTPSTGSFTLDGTTGTWVPAGSETTVTFTNGTSGQARFSSISVITDTKGTESVVTSTPTLSIDDLQIAAGGVATLNTSTDYLDGTKSLVSYTSNNTSVATVNSTSGAVSGVASGTATITATTESVSTDWYIINSASASCSVTVTDAVIYDDITVNDWDYTFESNPWGATSGDANLVDGQTTINWALTASYAAYNSGYLALSTSNNISSATIKTNNVITNVNSVVVYAKTNSGKKVTLTVKAGNTTLGSYTLSSATTLTAYTFTAESSISGKVSIEFTNPDGGYQIKEIRINPAPATVTGISVESYTSTYAVSATGNYSFDGKVFANYSDDSKVELSSSDYSVSGSVNLAVAGTYPLTFTYGDFSQTIIITVSSTKESYTIVWNSTNNSTSVSAYTSTWSVTSDGLTCSMANWNNNNNGWNYVKAGRKNNTSIATITTNSAIPEAIKTVTLTIDAVTADKINSLKLYVSTTSSFTNATAFNFDVATGDKSVTISSPATNCYYRIEADCASGSSNGLITVSKLVFSTK